MNIDDKTRMNGYISFIKESALKSSLNASDDVILTLATKLFISNNIQTSKIKQPIKPELPATLKQLDFLNKLKIKYPINITKKDAMELIKKNKIY